MPPDECMELTCLVLLKPPASRTCTRGVRLNLSLGPRFQAPHACGMDTLDAWHVTDPLWKMRTFRAFSSPTCSLLLPLPTLTRIRTTQPALLGLLALDAGANVGRSRGRHSSISEGVGAARLHLPGSLSVGR